MNSIIRKCAAAALSAVVAFHAVQLGVLAADTAEEYPVQKCSYRYIPKAGADPVTDVCYYSDSYFTESAAIPNAHLASMSMSLAFSSFQETSAEFVTELFDHLGFSDIRTDEMEQTPTRESIGSAIAHRSIGGQELVAVAIRGSRYLNEWCATLTAGASGDIEGFAKPSEKIAARIREYIAENGLKNVKLWITGYSRGGAVADLTGVRINEHPEDFSTQADDVYVYTFEAPQCSENPAVYENIFCYFNCNDVVARLYPASWGMYRNGQVIQICEEMTLPAKKFNMADTDHIRELGSVPSGQFLADFIDFISADLTRAVYSGECGDAVTDIVALLLSKTPEERQQLFDYCKGELLTAAKENHTDFLKHILSVEVLGGIVRHNSDKMYRQLTDELLLLAESIFTETAPPLTDAEQTLIKDSLYPLLRAVGPVIARDFYTAVDAGGDSTLPENYGDPDYDPQTDPVKQVPTYAQECEMEAGYEAERQAELDSMTDEERGKYDGKLAAYSDGDEDGYAGTPNASYRDVPENAADRSAAYLAAYKMNYADIYREAYDWAAERRADEDSMTEADKAETASSEPAFIAADTDAKRGESHYRDSYDDTPVPFGESDPVITDSYAAAYKEAYARSYDQSFRQRLEELIVEDMERPFYYTCTFLLNLSEILGQHYPQTNLLHVQQLDSYYTGSESAYFTAEPAADCMDGVLTLADGTEWYKVKEFESGKDYLISVQDADGTPLLLTLHSGEGSSSVWRFFRRTIMPSTAPLYMSLTANGLMLRNRGGVPAAASSDNIDSEISWDTAGSLLHLCTNGIDGYLRYDGAFSFVSDPSQASAVTIYTQGETLARCITGQPHAEHYVLENSGYEAPVFTVSVGDAVTDSVTWYVDGVKQKGDSLHFTAKSLADQPAGVHRVSCLVEAHDGTGVHYRERSAEALFIIAKGVLPDSVLTFSDVHEQYDLIGSAIETVMQKNGGYIPALMLCTGDFVNDHNLGKDGLLNTLYPQIKAQLGGLDAVFVAGNHDSGEACAYLSDKAGLGDESGAIFCGKSNAAAERGTNSLLARNVTVFGLHYDAALQNRTVSYARIMDSVEAFLQKTAAQYHGELVILSAHSGLHTVDSWAGGNAYNPDGSYALAELINRYAEEYHMDILYLFGHNHSRGELEMLLTDGDAMRCTVDSASQTSDTLTLHFTYANAGYLSDVIGSADRAFSLITREADRTVIELMRTDGETLRRTEIPTKYRPFAAPEQIAEMAKTDFAQKTGLSADAEIVQSDADCVTVRLYGADGNTLDTYTIDPATGTGSNAAGETVDLPQTGNADPAVLLFTGCALMLLTGGALCCKTALRRKRNSQGIAAR